ncbi:MAG: type II toxin-antitoxin system antitoxin SocA domain-containing protein [Ignavibacteriaceae bacterium]|jgi:uncharacterized phage-associated protein
MKIKIECPHCKGQAVLLTEKVKRRYRNDEFEVYEHFHKCNKCGYAFTNNETDRFNLSQVQNLYREKYHIPFPDQLTALRVGYGLSAAKMSGILGFGANQYRLYENGEMPTGGNATVLSIILDPSQFRHLLLKKNIVNVKIIVKVSAALDEMIKSYESPSIEDILFPCNIIPNRFTGFSMPAFDKFANMVLFFINDAPFKVKLNKLLFFADFANFKYSGYSISGCKYAAIPMGPVPNDYSLIFGLLESKEYLTTTLVKIKDKEYDKFIPLKKFNKSLFNASEIDILQQVSNKFKSLPTEKIKNITHEDKAWLDNQGKKAIIDYSKYAPLLKAL